MGVIKRNGNTYGGGASADGKAESSTIASVFDETVTYAEGDRVMYEDELYVFNTAHTGAWDAADADKSDVDSEMPEKLTAAQMAAIKAAFVIDTPRNGYPVLFDETGAEHFVGWYKYADGTKKPVYQKTIVLNPSVNISSTSWYESSVNISDINGEYVMQCYGYDTQFPISVPMICLCVPSLSTKLKFLICRDNDTCNISNIIIQYTKTTDTPQ